MTEYSIKNVKGHILIETDGGLVLVDTGSPFTFHEDGEMTVCGKKFDLLTSFPGIVDSRYISDKLGVTVKGLLGMDIISQHTMSIDLKNGILAFDCDTEGWTPAPSSRLCGLMTVTVNVAGKPARVFLDTGAPTSYISPAYINPDTEPLEYVKDFSPMSGDFETPIFELPCNFAGEDFTMRLGNLPDVLNFGVSSLGAQGAVGLELLKRFRFLITPQCVFVKEFRDR